MTFDGYYNNYLLLHPLITPRVLGFNFLSVQNAHTSYKEIETLTNFVYFCGIPMQRG